MSVNASQTAIASGGSIITVWGLVTGLPADLIFPAFIGALWALRTTDESRVFWRVIQVVGGTLVAAWATPAFAGLVPVDLGLSSDTIRYPIAVACGWSGLGLIHLMPNPGKLLRGEK